MVKKSMLIGILFLFVILVNGCTLAKGVSGFAQGAKEGAEEDWKLLKKADDWVKSNLW